MPSPASIPCWTPRKTCFRIPIRLSSAIGGLQRDRVKRSVLHGLRNRLGSTSLSPFGVTTLGPAIRAGRAFRRDPLAFLLGLQQTGDVIRFQVGFSQFALINSPDLIHRVLVTENDRFGEGKWTQRGHYVMHDCLITREGESHRQRRGLLQSSFAHYRIAVCGLAMVEHTQRLAEGWRDGQILDVRKEMGRIALALAGATLFSLDLEPNADEIVRALGVMLHAMSRLPVPRPRLVTARRLLRRTAARMHQGHLVTQLREAGLSDTEVQDEIVAMLIASVDTTSRTLAWTWFVIGSHQEVESRLHAELSEVLSGRPPTLEDLPRLPYLELVLTEVLRLYPPVHFIDRRALEDMDLNGARLRAGEYILLSPRLTHRDPRFYDEPSQFRPERWHPDGRKQRPQYSYFPFGGGPHVCIGMGLARMELALVVATLAQHWRLKPSSSLLLEPSPQTSYLPMTLERRL
jgi:cytochrome P450